MTNITSGSITTVGSVKCKIIRVRTINRKLYFANLFKPRSLAFISIIVDNMEETYSSNTFPYSSDIIFNFSETIPFNSQSTILFSFYRKYSSESSILVSYSSVTSKALIASFSSSLKTTMKIRLEMFPANSGNPNSYYSNMVIEFSCFVNTDISEALLPANNISNTSRIDSTHTEHNPDPHIPFSQPPIDITYDKTNHAQESQLLPHELKHRINKQGWEDNVYYNSHKIICKSSDTTNTTSKCLKVTNENDSNIIFFENLNIEAGTNTLAHQIWKGQEITVIDQYFGFLPEGWEIRFDVTNNLTLFADCISKKILEYDPRFQNFFNLKSPLTENWEIRVLPGQLPFFMNRTSLGNTTNIDPRIGLDSYASGGNFLRCVRDTREKILFFQQLCQSAKNPTKKGFTLNREKILMDSFHKIMRSTSIELHRSIYFYFFYEVGVDAGGVTREWFYLISLEISKPIHGLFKTCESDNYYIQINPNSSMKTDHLLYFRFVGRILAMALFHGYKIFGGFESNFYKRILGRRQTMEDLKMTDIVIFNSLKWICENDIEKEDLELYFCTESDLFGTMIVTELIPKGKNFRVTQSNKFDYINLITEWTLNSNTSEQMSAIKTAFFEVIPWPWIAFFDEKELELLLCGTKSYDIQDWRNNTEYSNGYCPNSKQIQWFWALVETFESEQIARLLQFATGTVSVPITGFRDLYGSNWPRKFNIKKWGAVTHLPQSQTCFNQIELPPYNTFEELKSKLLTAIDESSGFHLK